MPFENGMISEILKPEGYNTFITGKWHVAPRGQYAAHHEAQAAAMLARVY